MTEKQKKQVRQRECRLRLNELAAVESDKLTDEQRAELDKLSVEFSDLDRAIVALEKAEEPASPQPSADSRPALEGRCRLHRIVGAVVEHRAVDGPERELQSELKLEPNQVPLSLLRPEGAPAVEEHRAATAAPSNVGRQQQPVIQAVFPQSCAAFLGVPMPTVSVGESVFPVLSTRPPVAALAAGATQSETTGSYSAEVLSPSRLQASYFYRREDAAKFKQFDASLRENLNMALADGLDREILVGSNGLLTGTNLPDNAVSADADYPHYIQEMMLKRVDGRWASTMKDVRIVMGTATYSDAGIKYTGSSGNVDAYSALDKLSDMSAGVRVSAHVPAPASGKQNALIRRGMRRDAVCPIWEGVTLIPDEVTRAASGEIVLTTVLLFAFQILRQDGFWKQETQIPS